MPKLLDAAAAKAPTLRNKAVAHLGGALAAWEPAALDKCGRRRDMRAAQGAWRLHFVVGQTPPPNAPRHLCRCGGAIGALLKERLSDADGAVRASSRECLVALYGKLPAVASQVHGAVGPRERWGSPHVRRAET